MRRRYLQLPRDYPQDLRDQAVEITASASSEYQHALALQDFFRNNFTYDLIGARQVTARMRSRAS